MVVRCVNSVVYSYSFSGLFDTVTCLVFGCYFQIVRLFWCVLLLFGLLVSCAWLILVLGVWVWLLLVLLIVLLLSFTLYGV